MEITNAQIKYFRKSGFYSASNENLKHIKVLPHFSVVQSMEGSYDIALGDEAMKQTGDRGFFIAPSGVQQTIVHHVNGESGKMSARWVFLDVEINGIHKIDSLYRFPTVIKDEQKTEINKIFDRLFSTDDVWQNYSDCYQLLGFLLQMATPVQKEPHRGIQHAVAYITEHYAEQITVENLASIANMSQSNFYTVFKKVLGNSPISYLNHYRLSIAAERLVGTEQAIKEISYAVGFNDVLYFRKLFKKTYGLTPKEYQTTYRSQYNIY